MRKPIDKIMIRYPTVPTDFSASFESYFASSPVHLMGSQTSAKAAAVAQAATDTLATLGRHMHHKRWLWMAREASRDDESLSTILSAIVRYVACLLPAADLLCRKRLAEGFHFAYNKTGMTNMVLEIEMQVDGGSVVPCVLQYILFPPQNGPSAGKE